MWLVTHYGHSDTVRCQREQGSWWTSTQRGYPGTSPRHQSNNQLSEIKQKQKQKQVSGIRPTFSIMLQWRHMKKWFLQHCLKSKDLGTNKYGGRKNWYTNYGICHGCCTVWRKGVCGHDGPQFKAHTRWCHCEVYSVTQWCTLMRASVGKVLK